jgi:outer membrane protein assembly factor BamD
VRRLRPLLPLALCALAVGCASGTANVSLLSSPSDQVVWDAAQKSVKKKEWTAARQYLRRIVDAFPQSQHQADARIALADAYFDEGGTANYVLAASTYREFLALYPQHAKSDFAQFRVAECYFKQKNSPDRDSTTTEEALREYERVLDVYPQSSYGEQTRQRIHQCRQSLARGHFLVGSFYQRARKACRAAVGRYEMILRDYPDYEQTDEVLFRIAQCLSAAGRYAEALPHIGRLARDYPKSRFLAPAEKLRASFPPSAPQAPPASGPQAPPPPTPAEPAKATPVPPRK